MASPYLARPPRSLSQARDDLDRRRRRHTPATEPAETRRESEVMKNRSVQPDPSSDYA